MMPRFLVLTLFVAGCAVPQRPPPSKPPPPIARDAFLEQYAATFRFRLGCPRSIAVTPDGAAVLFLRSTGPRSFVQDLQLFDPSTGRERRLLGAADLLEGKAEQLSTAERARRERQRLL